MPKTRRTVRLSPEERAALSHSFAKTLGRCAGSVVRLFGSRAKAGAGGDIDILVSLAARPRDPFTLRLRVKQAVEDALGERKIDVVMEHPGSGADAFVRLARREGVVIWRRR